jgi:hypothetical protein
LINQRSSSEENQYDTGDQHHLHWTSSIYEGSIRQQPGLDVRQSQPVRKPLGEMQKQRFEKAKEDEITDRR